MFTFSFIHTLTIRCVISPQVRSTNNLLQILSGNNNFPRPFEHKNIFFQIRAQNERTLNNMQFKTL